MLHAIAGQPVGARAPCTGAPRRHTRAAVLIAALLGAACALAGPPVSQPAADSQPAPTTTQAASQPASAPTTQSQPAREDPLRSARSTMQHFLVAVAEADKTPERIEDAIACLDLSDIPQDQRDERGALIAHQLAEIIERIGVVLEAIPDDPAAGPFVVHEQEDRRIELARGPDGRWRFTRDTVRAVPLMYAALVKAASTQPEPQVDTRVPAAFRTPRATMRTFLEAVTEGDLRTAAACLDLSELPKATALDIGQRLAVKLKAVMDRIKLVVYAEIPDTPVGPPYVWLADDVGVIELVRIEEGEQAGYWLFSEATVRSVEKLFAKYQDRPRIEGTQPIAFRTAPWLWVHEHVGPALRRELLGLRLWKWIVLALTLLLGLIVHRIAGWLLGQIAHRWFQSERLYVPPETRAIANRPLGILAMVLVWWLALELVDLPRAVMDVLWPAMRFVLTVAGVWSAYRLVDLVAGYFSARAARSVSRLDDVLVPLLRKTAKIVVVAVGIVLVLQALGVSQANINRIFAGLGLGGLAFALAAQDSLKNFFGSVTVVLDRPFQVGDWVKVGDVEGTVESVGLRSTRIRTFYNSEIYIPNADLVNATVDNLGRRRYRRIKCYISVTYDTPPEKLEAFCEGIRELIRKHPYTRKDYYHVWVHQFAPSSIDILHYCFLETPDWGTELRERHRLFLDIIRLAGRGYRRWR